MRYLVMALAVVVGLHVGGAACIANEKKAPASTRPAKAGKDDRGGMDYGAFLSTSVSRAAGKLYKPVQGAGIGDAGKVPIDPIPDGIAQKGIVIRVGSAGHEATLCFDADAVRMAGGWTGGWLDLTGTMLTNHKGTSHVTLTGEEAFVCTGPGWGAGDRGDDFTDPRAGATGPLPEARARYGGLYVHGDRVVLSYRVAGAEVLELPGYDAEAGAFTRTILVEEASRPVTAAICDAAGGTVVGNLAMAAAGERVIGVALLTAPDAGGAAPKLFIAGGQVRAALPEGEGARHFTIAIASAPKGEAGELTKRLAGVKPGPDPKALCGGGPARWKPLMTVGRRGAAPAGAAYAVDALTVPDPNPYRAWMRLSGLAFLPDGQAVVCTLNGDVWIVSGIDDALARLTWTRFAAGLYHPMGIAVVKGDVYVRGRDQITRLRDLNSDGEADFYENFNNEGTAHPSYHGFAFDLQTDEAGNFYYARGGIGMAADLPGQGRLIKLSADGKTVTPLATGLRAPNGLGVGGAGPWVTVSDNQGNWIPSSKIHLIDPKAPPAFLGFLPHHHMEKVPAGFAAPLVWIPHKIDNSSGGQAYIASDRWGPYRGQWVHTSFGMASLMLLLPDGAAPAGEPPKQAAVVAMPLSFATGIMRPCFNPTDGQLYACGVGGGWQTKGTADGGLYRVRRTSAPAHQPCGFSVVKGGVQLTFPLPLDKKEASDPGNWAVEQWNYKWTSNYGSPDFSATTPGKAGHDAVEVESVTISDDGRTAAIHLPHLAPVMQMLIQYRLKWADGAAMEDDVYATINVVPKQ